MNKPFILIIRFYRYFISPLLGSNCRFYPTCSEYSMQCFKRFSFPRAVWYSTKRILKCNQFFPGGIDEIPSAGVDNE